MPFRFRRSWFLVLVCLLIAVPAAPAWAHSNLTASSPLNGTWVPGPIDTVELTFSNPIQFDVSQFQVIDSDGAPRGVGETTVSADRLTVVIALDPPVREGLVGVGYTVIAGDSHPRIGSITFGVGEQPPDAPRPNLARLLDPPRAYGLMIQAERLLRAVGYASTLLLVGALAYRGWISRRPMPPLMLGLSGLAAVGLFVAGIGIAATQSGIRARGETSALFDVGLWARTLDASTTGGLALRVAGALVALALLLRGVAPERWNTVAAAVIAAGVGAIPLLGHGSSRDPLWLVFPADTVHVIAVAIWSGGLVSLGVDVWHGRSATAVGGDDAPVDRYSTVALGAFVAAAVTGTILAFAYIDVGDLLGTAYGKRLVVKLFAVGLVLIIAGYHRFRVVPRLASERASSGLRARFVASIVVEVALMTLIIAITVLLVEALP